jgi:hypothetical protein
MDSVYTYLCEVSLGEKPAAKAKLTVYASKDGVAFERGNYGS